jgi:hypothetical protein
MKYFPFLFFYAMLILSCGVEKKYDTPSIKKIQSPCKEGGESNLFVSQNNKAYLSWVEYVNDSTDALMVSELINDEWTNPNLVSSGSDWFVNWADFPSVVKYDTGESYLAAHWLQKSENGIYDYDVHISQSKDNGKTWSPSFVIHKDSIAAEHGFVSMVPISKKYIFATWLDGRNTKVKDSENHSDSHEDHGHGHGGAMTLRAAEFDIDGNISKEVELDNRVCDCCQTSAAMTDNGIVVAYRDRSEDEIRDISIVREVNGHWTEPKTISNDNWKIAGCPVNGPSIAANGQNLAIAWFTMLNEKPVVRIAFSSDGGENIGLPIKVDEGNPLGRIDLIYLNENEVLVSWMEERKDYAEIIGVRMNEKGFLGERFVIAKTDTARKSGFPIMKKYKNDVLVSWTKVDSLSSVNTALLQFN